MSTTSRSTQGSTRHSPLLILSAGLVIALISALAIFIPILNPPVRDIGLLILFLGVSGGVSVIGAYAIYRSGVIRRFRSLRWTLLIMNMLTVLLLFLNVWVTAQLMFISVHDFWLTTALLVFAGLTATAFGLFTSNTMTERIEALAQASRQLATGDWETRVMIRGNDELAELATTFNWMAHSLQEMDSQKNRLEQARRDLIAWVSHDLRTPLSTMQAMMEAIQDGVVSDPETLSRYMTMIQSEMNHLNHLIDDLFELSRLDVGALDLRCEWASLHDLLSDTLGSLQSQADQLGITLESAVAPDIDPIRMASDKIQRVLNNLLRNATEHTPAGGTITLRAWKDGDTVRVDVHNTGAPIAAADLPHVFERFYRGQDVQIRGRQRQRGAGLGLAITKGIIQAHHGWVRAISTAGAGTTFSFAIPCNGPPD